jgi:hypothetical protein
VTEFLTFALQGSLVYLLGIQTLNVAGGHYVLAGLTSFLLAACGYYTNAAVAEAGFGGLFGPLWWSYCMAGVLFAPLSMWTHPQLVRLYVRVVRNSAGR